MYNHIILMGRITADPELKLTSTEREYVNFSIAVDQYVKDGEDKTDFFRCTAWGKTAIFISKYFGKGAMILIDGDIHNDNYKDGNGVQHYGMQVTVRNASFTGEKKTADEQEEPPMPEE